MSAAGLLLAAGAGRRMGRPKALVLDQDGTSWLRRSADALIEGGCAPVLVVLGAGADQARSLLPGAARVVIAEDWESGMSASLRAGLAALSGPTDADQPESVLVSLVDLPDVGAEVIRRVLARGSTPADLHRAAYDADPGHPVLIGRHHIAGVLAGLDGDAGARDYLASHGTGLVECGDLATGRDRDRPTDVGDSPTPRQRSDP